MCSWMFLNVLASFLQNTVGSNNYQKKQFTDDKHDKVRCSCIHFFNHAIYHYSKSIDIYIYIYFECRCLQFLCHFCVDFCGEKVSTCMESCKRIQRSKKTAKQISEKSSKWCSLLSLQFFKANVRRFHAARCCTAALLSPASPALDRQI